MVDKTKEALTNIWIDFENPSLPKDLSPHDYYQRIVDGLRKRGFTGPVKITIFVGYLGSIKKTVENVLSEKITVVYAIKCNMK